MALSVDNNGLYKQAIAKDFPQKPFFTVVCIITKVVPLKTVAVYGYYSTMLLHVANHVGSKAI